MPCSGRARLPTTVMLSAAKHLQAVVALTPGPIRAGFRARRRPLVCAGRLAVAQAGLGLFAKRSYHVCRWLDGMNGVHTRPHVDGPVLQGFGLGSTAVGRQHFRQPVLELALPAGPLLRELV